MSKDENALLKIQDQQLSPKYFNITPNSFSMIDNTPYEVWQQAGELFQTLDGSIHWWVGDWLNAGEKAYGETYKNAMRITGFAKQTLKNDKYVSSHVEKSLRKDILSWNHHMLVAPLNPKDQEHFLNEAVKNSWSEKELRNAIKKWKHQDDDFIPELYTEWRFSDRDLNLGVEHPGNIPGQIVMNLLYYYTNENDFIVDPFAGGGSTIDACKKMKRRCKAYDIDPKRDDIIYRDIIKDGFDPDLKDVKLIFLDPPYWIQKSGNYTNEPTDLSNMSLDQYYASMETIFNEAYDVTELIGIIIGRTQEGAKYFDHASVFRNMLSGIFEEYINDILIPYSTQQYASYDVIRAKKHKYMLNLNRNLLIFRRR
jgi:hypothetical protein